LKLEDFTENSEVNWDEIQNELKNNAINFENLLFKIHIKRKKQGVLFPEINIQKLLTYAYLITNDIRYYNEFLWCYFESTSTRIFKEECDIHFLKNLNQYGVHSHNFDLSGFNSVINKSSLLKNNISLNGKKIGLVGLPIFFGEIHSKLKKHGADVIQIFIPLHPSKFFNALFHNRLLIKVLNLLNRNFYHYHTLNYQINDTALSEQLKSFHFDIGFHKLNFIIKPNIFNAFKTGLINDHWGVLPFIRGKSTLAYSLLLGFPIIVTTHLVEKGIDTGKIINYYPYNINGLKKIKKIKNKVKRDLSRRMFDSIQCIANPEFQFTDNQLPDGLTFYEIHPQLYKHIENKILNKK
jgi:folate-dependent phosphoribosylglycinamide formyltransferase PurN